MNRVPRSLRTLALAVCSLLAPRLAAADVSLLVNEPIGYAGEIHGGGHAAIYLSNICSDDAVTVRLCTAGEHGVVVSTYPDFVPQSPPYWMAVPLGTYLFGVDDPAEAPIYGSPALLAILRLRFARVSLSRWTNGVDGGAAPPGEWPSLVGNVFKRNVYAFQLHTTTEQDRKVIAVLTAVQGRREFDMSYNNCSDFARLVLDTYFPGAVHRDLFNDFTFTTPKAIARTLTAFGRAHPELGFQVTRYRQLDGPISRSQPNRTLTEKAITSKKYLALTLVTNPIVTAVFGGLYAVTGRFSLEGAFEKSMTSSEVADGGMARGSITPAGGFTGARASLTNGIDTAATSSGWRQYHQSFDRLTSEAIARGVFSNRAAVKNFLHELESTGIVENGAEGQLQIRVGMGADARLVALTRTGLADPSSDARLAYQTMMSVVAHELDEGRRHRPTLEEFAADWRLLQALHDRRKVWEDSAPPICARGGTCRPAPRSSTWVRLVTFVTR